MIRLTKQQAEKIGYMKITDWFAIQPIEIKDGTYILPKEVLPYIEKFLTEKKAIDKIKVVSTLSDLKKYPVRAISKDELKEPEQVEGTKKIVK